jgi:mRNA-degrading endonuclease RelE of RelBE toxin-antitoxin system
MYTPKYHKEVATDIHNAKIWYKEQQEGLEERFAFAIEEAIVKVLQMPSAYSIRHRNIRIAHPKIFPYNIHFYIDETNSYVVFIGVVHNKREDGTRLMRF